MKVYGAHSTSPFDTVCIVNLTLKAFSVIKGHYGDSKGGLPQNGVLMADFRVLTPSDKDKV